MNNRILLLLLCFVSSWNIYGQTKKAFLAAAEEAVAQQNFHGALVYFDEALTFDKNDPEVVFKTAEAARNYNAYGFASRKYQYLIDSLKNNDYPQATYRLGEMYQKLGYYDKSMEYYNLYLSEYSNEDPILTSTARLAIASCKTAKELIKNVDKNTTVTRLGDDVNSADADFAGSDFGGNMYFSSMKYESTSKALRYKQIAKTLVKSTDNMAANVISGYVNDRDQSVANFAFNAKGTKVYYSICDYVNGFKQRCDIYSSTVDAKGNLSNEEKLPSFINNSSSTNTQPNVGFNATTGKESLYFVSDREGGMGGMDIWSCIIEGNSYGKPENVQAINTKGDDITPFYHRESNALYFSTDGREGFGGFDVFKQTSPNATPVVMPSPYNTSMNDIYFYLTADGNKGYVTSNRAGSNYQFESYEACCMDIYGVDVKNDDIKLEAFTYYTPNSADLDVTKVCLIDSDTGAELECITSKPGSNNHIFTLKPNRNYKLVATKDGHTIDTQTFRTDGSQKTLTKKLYLNNASIKLDVFTFDNATKAALAGTTVTLINLTDGTSKQVVLNNANGNDFSFDVEVDKDYKIVATKDGYTIATDMISTKGAKGNIKKDMFLQKMTLQELLPISLYFDNDYPNPRSNSPKTTTQYVALANDYIRRKDDYIRNFTQPLSGQDKINAESEIVSFFTNDVENGRDKFVKFLLQLEQRLASGEKIELEVRGFASPRAKSDYNKILSERRINCIKNEMSVFGGGGIKKYLDQGDLKLKDVSFGNERAAANVIGDLKDERNSIYNMDAARERRVEILKVNYN